MLSGYRAGYVTGRLFTRIVKIYLTGKLFDAAGPKVAKLANDHKIDSKDPEAVTNNLYDCIKYLD